MKNVNMLYGPPGSGKTSLSELMPDNINYISVGNIARQEILNDTDIGREIEERITKVEEFSQDLVRRIIAAPIKEAQGKILLDGFPKFVREVEVLEEIMKEHKMECGYLFNIEVEREEAWDRIKNRLYCPGCNFQSTTENVCPKCKTGLEKREDDNYDDFSLRYYDYEVNNSIIKERLESIGFKVIELSTGTAKMYSDIITEKLAD